MDFWGEVVMERKEGMIGCGDAVARLNGKGVMDLGDWILGICVVRRGRM